MGRARRAFLSPSMMATHPTSPSQINTLLPIGLAGSMGWLEMEIDQIVGLLQEVSRDKQFKFKGMLNTGGR